MSEISLRAALESLESSSAKLRAEGLGNLKHVLKHNRNSSNIEHLQDDSFQTIYQRLFRVADQEVSSFSKAKTPVTTSRAANQLAEVASALRLLVEISVRVLKLRTVRALFDHVDRHLFSSTGELCEPLALDYVKSLRTILTYRPHVEFLVVTDPRSKDDGHWERVVDFCLDCIKKADRETDLESTTGGAEMTLTPDALHVSYRSSRSVVRDSSGSQSGRHALKQVVEEVIGCLCLLTAAPSAPIHSRAPVILRTLLEFLRTSNVASRSSLDAFTTINHVLRPTRTENVTLTQQSTSQLTRLIRMFWFRASVQLKDEMLATLILLRPYIFAAMRREDGLALQTELHSLRDALWTEYSKRPDRELKPLSLDDIRLQVQIYNQQDSGAIMTSIFGLKCCGIRAESNWALVHMLASLSNVLATPSGVNGAFGQDPHDDSADDVRPPAAKRQRLSESYTELLAATTSKATGERVCALQTIVFLAQQKRLDPKQLLQAIDILAGSCNEEASTVSSWALIALASCASQSSATDSTLASRWDGVWQVACRSLSSASSSRAASYCLYIMLRLRLVAQTRISELFQLLTHTMDVQGPTLIGESVTAFLSEVLRHARLMSSHTSSQMAESVLNWLVRNFTPSRLDNRQYSASSVVYEAADVVSLVAICLGQPTHALHRDPSPTWDTIGRTWILCQSRQDLMAYLLLQESDESMINDALGTHYPVTPVSLRLLPQLSSEGGFLTAMASEVRRVNELCSRSAQTGARDLNLDGFALLCKVCCILSCICFCLDCRDSRRQEQLQHEVMTLTESLCSTLGTCDEGKFDVLLSIFSCSFHGMPASNGDVGQPTPCEKFQCQRLGQVIKNRQGSFEQFDPDDAMEGDSMYESQESAQSHSAQALGVVPGDLEATFSKASLRASTIMYINIVSIADGEAAHSKSPAELSASIMDHILAQPDIDILASRRTTANLDRMGITLTSADLFRLLEYLMESIIGSPWFGKSEMAHVTTLEIMSKSTAVWTDRSDAPLYDLAIDTYDWFTSTCSNNRMLSPQSQRHLATLLLKICSLDEKFPHDTSMMSVRTALYGLVQRGSVTVQFDLADHIPAVFGRFIVTDHEAMFSDLLDSLPIDLEWLEGIAMRLRFLSRLAAARHSLLRLCVYYVFETAGRVEASLKHTASCIRELASTLPLRTPRRLFSVFAPQLLHTWLESHSLESIPFGAFGYSSLTDLLEINQTEICAQLVMREAEDALTAMARALELTPKDLVERSFAKCYAYATVWDVSTAPGKSPTQATSRLQELVGTKECLKRLLQEQYPAVVGYLFLSSQQEDVNDSWLDSRPGYESAHQALAEMKGYGYSARTLPTAQQPSFRGKHLRTALERLARRVENPNGIFMPSSFTLTARMLFDAIDESLGSLHACLIIRRLRILIAFAGGIALSGFPLEMLVHSLRPFIRDVECADDTLGVLQYLHANGREHMKKQSSFMGGTITLLILQMGTFSGHRQEGTQESQYNATVQKMLGFQSWLVKYLAQMRPSNDWWAKLVNSLERIRLPGNAQEGSPESVLMLLLLDQLDATDPICSRTDVTEALGLLSKDFDNSMSAVDDCLGDNQKAIRYAQALWEVFRTADLGDAFTTWAARVLGRAYASSGVRPYRSIRHTPAISTTVKKTVGATDSSRAIVGRLCEILGSKDRSQAGLAEYTLRQISAALTLRGQADEMLAFEQMLSPELTEVVRGGIHGYVPAIPSESIITKVSRPMLRQALEVSSMESTAQWISHLASVVCAWSSDVPIVSPLGPIAQAVNTLAGELFPFIIHILLVQASDRNHILRVEVSAAMASAFSKTESDLVPKQQFLLKLLLYLRTQPMPQERSWVDRLGWVEVDFLLAAQAAARCGMPSCSLLFAESAAPVSSVNKRASRSSLSQTLPDPIPNELLLTVFKQMEEPDSFYGVQQSASLETVLGRLDHEGDGFRSLMLRSAQMDSRMRQTHSLSTDDAIGIVRSLSALNLNSLTFSLLTQGLGDASTCANEMLTTARTLQQWDITPPESSVKEDWTNFKVFQELSRASDMTRVQNVLTGTILDHVRSYFQSGQTDVPAHAWYGALGTLAEINEVTSSATESGLQKQWQVFQSREDWMRMARFEHVSPFLVSRKTLFGVIGQNTALRRLMHVSEKQARRFEVQALLESSMISRGHAKLQEALADVTLLKDLVEHCVDAGLEVGGAINYEAALVLWQAEEVSVSVKMLQDVLQIAHVDSQDLEVGRPGLLAQLGHELADARLEKPEVILSKYLKPAIDELHNRRSGAEAGKVYYEFATFCDNELQNPGNVENFQRVIKLRQGKEAELAALKSAKRSGSMDAQELARSLTRTQKWLELDTAEEQRLRKARNAYVQQSLQCYLVALQATDDHDLCVLRFFALWLENADQQAANATVAKYLGSVPSWKLVRLMNQLISRLDHESSTFQDALKALLLRVFAQHPLHSLHHLYISQRMPYNKDATAISRQKAAQALLDQLKTDRAAQEMVSRTIHADERYNILAQSTPELARGVKSVVRKSWPPAEKVAHHTVRLQVPPATISLPLRPGGDYRDVPSIVRWSSEVQIYGGLSAPKVMTAYASDGKDYKQLFKSGNDDLRQDAIMEQVFEEVSNMLQKHTATRQRDLKVRTYKVIPLSTRSGIIEFVRDSIPINDWLRPAHKRYHPSDYSDSKARGMIDEAQSQAVETRVTQYRKVCDHLHPVLRHFFFERFHDPDEWFEKRTAYTRTTASVSMLGHVLGLGDRHCSNIMLDEKTGEVVHIDLGVAFEAGRVLPIPELVPFRLTRDIVDGMGVTKTEGVFRRCCEFTVDALRDDKGSIMTLLNVLRYDPLYAWTSPVKIRRMQEAQEAGRNGDEWKERSSKKMHEEEAGEGERALSIVEKKLSKTLSTTAAVNELIQQATDIQNLATLFVGWAAFY